MRGDFRGPAEPTPLTRRGRYDEPDGSDGEALTPRFPHSFIIAFGRQHREARGLRRPAISGTSRGPRSGGPGSLRLGTRFSFRSAESRRVARVLRGWGVDSPLLPRRASRQLSAVSHARAFSRVAGLFGAGAATPGCHAPGFSRRHVVRRKPRRPPIAAPRPRGPGSLKLGRRFSPPPTPSEPSAISRQPRTSLQPGSRALRGWGVDSLLRPVGSRRVARVLRG